MAENKDANQQENIVAFLADGLTQQVMSATLSSLNIMNCQSLMGGVSEALAYLGTRRSPRILVVDISNSELPISDMQQISEACEPGTFVVVLGTRNDIGLFRDLLRLGVSDYVTKPINVDFMAQTLMNTIRGDSDAGPRQRVGKVLAFIGSRGGVGTTTIATNIAWLLSNDKFKRTLFLDLDLQFGNAPLLLDCKSQQGLKEALANPERIDQGFLEHSLLRHSDRLMFVAATENLESHEEFPVEAFDALMPLVQNDFHYIVVDVPRVASDLTRSVLNYAASIFIVTDLSLPGVRDTARILDLVGADRAKHKAFVIANNIGRYDRGELNKDEYQKAINHKVDFMIPHDAHSALVAANMGKTISSISSMTSLNEAYRTLLDDISGTGNPMQLAAAATKNNPNNSWGAGSRGGSMQETTNWHDMRSLLSSWFSKS